MIEALLLVIELVAVVLLLFAVRRCNASNSSAGLGMFDYVDDLNADSKPQKTPKKASNRA